MLLSRVCRTAGCSSFALPLVRDVHTIIEMKSFESTAARQKMPPWNARTFRSSPNNLETNGLPGQMRQPDRSGYIVAAAICWTELGS